MYYTCYLTALLFSVKSQHACRFIVNYIIVKSSLSTPETNGKVIFNKGSNILYFESIFQKKK